MHNYPELLLKSSPKSVPKPNPGAQVSDQGPSRIRPYGRGTATPTEAATTAKGWVAKKPRPQILSIFQAWHQSSLFVNGWSVPFLPQAIAFAGAVGGAALGGRCS
jgi:hypothetical protein